MEVTRNYCLVKVGQPPWKGWANAQDARGLCGVGEPTLCHEAAGGGVGKSDLAQRHTQDLIVTMFYSPEGEHKCLFQSSTAAPWLWNAVDRSHPLLAISQLGGTQSSASLHGPAEGRPDWGNSSLGTPEWALGGCHSAPSLHLTPHNLTVTISPFASPAHGVRNYPREQIQHFPSLQCSEPLSGGREQRAEAAGVGETLDWNPIVTFGIDLSSFTQRYFLSAKCCAKEATTMNRQTWPCLHGNYSPVEEAKNKVSKVTK